MIKEYYSLLKKKSEGLFPHDEFPLKKEILVIFFSYLIGAACNYFYQIYVGRVLGPAEYGIFGALFSIIYLIYIFGYTIQTGIAWKTTKIVACGRVGDLGIFLRNIGRDGLLWSIAFFILFLLISPGIGFFIHFFNFVDFFLLGTVIILTILLSITSGIIQGMQEQVNLALLNIVTYFPKFLFAVIFLGLGWSLTGALAAQPLGMMIALVFSGLSLLQLVGKNAGSGSTDLKDVYHYIIPTLIVMICLAVPSNVDVIIAKNLFADVEAGLYVSASIIGKIVLFVSATITILVFPKMSELSARGKDTFHLFNFSLGYTLLLSGPAALFFFLFPGTIQLIFGSGYAEGAWIVQYYSVLMLFFSLIWVSAHYSLAVQKTGYVIILVAVTAFQIAALLVFRPTMADMLLMLIFGNLLLFIVGYVYLYKTRNSQLTFVQ